jgi:phosphate starvation-inducible PhoH-like protein
MLRPDNVAIRVKGISDNQHRYLQSIRENDFTLALGHAGSGKTYCAVGMALKHLFMPENGIKKIVVIRMALAAFGDSIGHLPGDAFDKMYPYFGSILDNIEEFIPRHVVRNLVKQEKLEIIPLSFLRGRTLKDSFIIVEEAQNVSIEAMKMILTRVGNGSKIVVTGDVNQRDKPHEECGLLDASFRFRDCPGFGIIHLYSNADIVRHSKTSRILELYENHGEQEVRSLPPGLGA